jgi:phosphoribosyl 1,2-cyclic phosphodiesterase
MIFKPHHSSSKGNLYELRSDAGKLIIDPGVSIKLVKQALDFDLSSVQGALASHGHGDHSKAIPSLIKSGIDVYLTAETAEALKVDGHRVNIIEPLKQFKIGTWTILPFPTYHDTPGSVGFMISDGESKLLFATDTAFIKNRFTGPGLTHIAIEVNYSDETMNPEINPYLKRRVMRSHMSLDTAIKFLRSTNLELVREIWVIHTSSDNGDKEYFKNEIEKATGKPTYYLED